MNKNKLTLSTYNEISETYGEKNRLNDTVQMQQYQFAKYLQEGAIYDFGCGTGRDVNAFTQMGFETVGFDGSQAMLDTANRLYPGNRFHHFDMLTPEWDFATRPNGIWACASLLHFERNDFVSVFAQLVDLLDDNGLFYLSLKTRENLSSEITGGRFFQYYPKEWLDRFIDSYPELEILHCEQSDRNEDSFVSYYLRKLA